MSWLRGTFWLWKLLKRFWIWKTSRCNLCTNSVSFSIISVLNSHVLYIECLLKGFLIHCYYFLIGLCTMVAVSWYAFNITQEFFDPFYPGTKYGWPSTCGGRGGGGRQRCAPWLCVSAVAGTKSVRGFTSGGARPCSPSPGGRALCAPAR